MYMQRAIGLFLCFILVYFLLGNTVRVSLKEMVKKEFSLEEKQEANTEEDNDSGRFFEEEFINPMEQIVHVHKIISKNDFFLERRLSDVHITLHYPPPNC